MSCRNGSSGFITRENSKPAPAPFGVQSGIVMPFGTYVKPRRTGRPWKRAAANAGVIASSMGSAMTAPTPLRKLRRGRCVRVTIMVCSQPFVTGREGC